jgi:DNA-binding NtrC family response regulator
MFESTFPAYSVLLVDDEEAWLRSLSMTLSLLAGITNIIRCADSRQAMDVIAANRVGLVLLDLNMPHLSGETLLTQLLERYPEIPVIIISGLNQVETAVECMKRGAFDFFVKTVEQERLIQGVQRAIKMIDLQVENREIGSRVLDDRLTHPEAFAQIITQDKAMHAIFRYLEAVSGSSQPVLITGESGVGKELLAASIHRLSGRKGKLVALNVAGLDDNIFSDTLFGHMKGAFTGADSVRRGLIEDAADGTLFLDEIGDLALASQIKLLRLLQEGEYFALGSDVPKRMRARVVFATHHDLSAKQVSGQFRKDLYYRLCVHHLHVPPLRQRAGDIPLLLDHFMEEVARELGKKTPTVAKELYVLLANHPFPGNVRELKSMVYDAVSVHQSRMLSMDAFKRAMGQHGDTAAMAQAKEAGQPLFVPSEPLPNLHDLPDLVIAEAMRRAKGNQSVAARLIGISQPALSKRLKKNPPQRKE